MTERLDAHNISVDTQLAQAGLCARIHLPSGWICGLRHPHRGSCRFVAPGNLPDAEKGHFSTTGQTPAGKENEPRGELQAVRVSADLPPAAQTAGESG